MPTIKVTDLAGEKSELEANVGETLMEALRDNGYDDIEAICGGVCSCSTCHVHIEDPEWFSKLGERSEDEFQLVSSTESYDENKSRLSCQITVTEDMEGLPVTIVKQTY